MKVRRDGISSSKGKEKDMDPHTAPDSSKRALPALAMEQFLYSQGSSAHTLALPPQGCKEFYTVYTLWESFLLSGKSH